MKVVLGKRIKTVLTLQGKTLDDPYEITDPDEVDEIKALVQRALAAGGPDDLNLPPTMSVAHRTEKSFVVQINPKRLLMLRFERVTEEIWEIDLD